MLSQVIPAATEMVLENILTIGLASSIFLFFCIFTRIVSASGSDEVPQKLSKRSEPLPRWEILSVLNYFVVGIFLTSFCFVVFNFKSISGSDENSENSLFPVLIIWCVCMAYFFGFFGISYLDKNAIVHSPSSFGLSQLDAKLSIERSKKINPERNLCSHRFADEPPSSETKRLSDEDVRSMSNEDLAESVRNGSIKDHQLETKLGDYDRAVAVRRLVFENKLDLSLEKIPHENYDYGKVYGANCETVCGYIPIPMGMVGPLVINNQEVFVPMATTEGCLVASTNRGCKAIAQGGGCRAVVLKDGITRAPCLRMPDAIGACSVKVWVESEENRGKIKRAFESTTSFGKLNSVSGTVAGRNIYLRFVCFAGDAMGMNMVSKGCLAVVDMLREIFPEIELIAISGNMCTDKKPAAINWIEGRGKSVVCEARIPAHFVETTLKTNVHTLVETNIQKNFIGSAMAGSLGGFNAHASNIVTAIFLATGQDPAQNVESSMCMTIMEEVEGDLLVSVNMPCIEVGTIGGGTSLPAQAACLDIIGCKGASKRPLETGDNAKKLAMVVAGAVMAGELSLMAALASNQLVKAHMQHNRKKN
mmetsp:Transcript_13353/g.18850  ORF Transcript_13353/g.18850 Transcript_13353/m.18850 type:complete len:591 (+) Transcript_13353:95-1867(+)